MNSTLKRYTSIAVWGIVLNIIIAVVATELRFKYIVIHHSASTKGNYQIIKRWHAQRGWYDAAYHLILSNGSTQIPLGHVEATQRYRSLSYSVGTRSKRCNLLGVHICIIGNYHTRPMPKHLKACVASAVQILQQKYHISDANVLLHRDCSSSACPGKFITANAVHNWIENLAHTCPSKIRTQQEQVISQARYSIRSFPILLMLITLSISVLILIIWQIVRSR